MPKSPAFPNSLYVYCTVRPTRIKLFTYYKSHVSEFGCTDTTAALTIT
jgi:hypothetical protein